METLNLDLKKSATRKTIFGKLIVAIKEEETSAMVGRVVADTSIPAQAQYANLAEVKAAIKHSIASDWAKEQAGAIYEILAEAEAEVHACTVEETHFHEVGLGMTVREILGMCTAIELLNKPKLVIDKVQVGSGKVECSHGVLDIPAPATAAILRKYDIAVVEEKLEGELCTPTSAAFIAHFMSE